MGLFRKGSELLLQGMATRGCRSSSQAQQPLGVGHFKSQMGFEMGIGRSTRSRGGYRLPGILQSKLPRLIEKKHSSPFTFLSLYQTAGVTKSPDYWQAVKFPSAFGFFRGINEPKSSCILVMLCSRIRFLFVWRVQKQRFLAGHVGYSQRLVSWGPSESYFFVFFLSLSLLSFTYERKSYQSEALKNRECRAWLWERNVPQ